MYISTLIPHIHVIGIFHMLKEKHGTWNRMEASSSHVTSTFSNMQLATFTFTTKM